MANERIQITLLDEAAVFLRDYSKRHNVSNAEATRRALGLLKLLNDLVPHEELAICNVNTGVIDLIEFPYRPRVKSRVIPDFKQRTRKK